MGLVRITENLRVRWLLGEVPMLISFRDVLTYRKCCPLIRYHAFCITYRQINSTISCDRAWLLELSITFLSRISFGRIASAILLGHLWKSALLDYLQDEFHGTLSPLTARARGTVIAKQPRIIHTQHTKLSRAYLFPSQRTKDLRNKAIIQLPNTAIVRFYGQWSIKSKAFHKTIKQAYFPLR